MPVRPVRQSDMHPICALSSEAPALESESLPPLRTLRAQKHLTRYAASHPGNHTIRHAPKNPNSQTLNPCTHACTHPAHLCRQHTAALAPSFPVRMLSGAGRMAAGLHLSQPEAITLAPD